MEYSDYAEDIVNLAHEDPIVRILALGKLNNGLKSYYEEGEPHTFLDKRLLKGFYIVNKNELKEQ